MATSTFSSIQFVPLNLNQPDSGNHVEYCNSDITFARPFPYSSPNDQSPKPSMRGLILNKTSK